MTESNFSNISTIIAQSSHVLSDLSTASNSVIAFTKNFPPIRNWIIAHIEQITDIALFEGNVTLESERYFCLRIICSKLPNFSQILSNNQQFLIHLNKFISNTQTITKKGLSSFSSIMQSIVKAANGIILEMFPEKSKLIQKLFKYIECPPIFSLLYFFTGDGNKYVVQFLDNEQFINEFFIYIKKCPNQILQLIKNFINNIDPNSDIMKHLTATEHLTVFFQIGISPNIFSSLQAFRLMLEICKICVDIDYSEDDEEEEDSIPIFDFVISKIPEICKFVTELPFTPADVSAIELLAGVIPALETIPDEIYYTANFFFEMMFQYPHHSELHLCCYHLFQAIEDIDSDVFNRIDIRPKIVYAYYNYRHDYRCVYWGHLHELTKLVIKSKLKTECPGWNEYINNMYRVKERLLKDSYGGVLPKDTRENDFLSTIDID